MGFNRKLSLVERIANRMTEETGVTGADAFRIIHTIGGTVRTELKKRNRVNLPMIGWFQIREWQARSGVRQPQAEYSEDAQRRFIKGSGVAIKKSARKRIHFQAHRTLIPSIISGVPHEQATLAWLRSKLVEIPDEEDSKE